MFVEPATGMNNRQLRARNPPDILEPRSWSWAEGRVGTRESQRGGDIIRGSIYLSRIMPTHTNRYV